MLISLILMILVYGIVWRRHDMIFIDGDTKPTLHGTGTEDYVNMSWCPTQEYNARITVNSRRR